MEERSSPSRVLGQVIRKVTLGGVDFTLSQCDKIRRAADEECVIVARRLDILAGLVEACDKLPEASKTVWINAALDKLMCGIASPDEWRSYYRSHWRLAFRFWNALDPSHKGSRSLLEGVTWAFEQIMQDGVPAAEMEALERAIEMVSQENEVKND